MKKTVLILEDDVDLAEGIELSLQSEELTFVICSTIAEGKDSYTKTKNGFNDFWTLIFLTETD